ncbi:MAG: UDP-N-acetylmuramoyl-L-alanyl-D-glutamate--2,6-diaminopimelate ligase [Acidobacteria bacterium]|nr:UDP-N-acetylmuramoyl-L-alanyl-D-glutamate--2,6-diaminopimelate ligase [Acidobacteriota bacterium]
MAKQTFVTLGEVARAVGGELAGDGRASVSDVTHDSRQVREGWLFVAIRGANVDAHRFIEDALRQGAAGVVSEGERPEGFRGSWVKVEDARRALALAAAEVHDHPSRELRLVGITGTNGKTTTAYLVAAMADEAGTPNAFLSTVEYRVAGERTRAEHTTPESSDIQRLLRRAVEKGCGVAVMEASSQALDLRRCDALRFDVAVFSNLTRDHLDYHGTMETYFAAKLKLFDGSLGERPRVSIINVDDEYGVRLAEELEKEGERVVRYALEAAAEVTARDVEFTLEGVSFRLITPQGESFIESPLVGRPHIYNALAAAATGLEHGFGLEAVTRALKVCAGAPGRFERVPNVRGCAVVVDFAHTDDALLNVLRTARDVTRGRVITVFGCGGDRDRSKRAPMGEVAARLSDIVIATSDNPRTEDPETILDDIEVGLRASDKAYVRVADRREAIRRAIREARPGDLVLIAGKGHEDYQIVGETKQHFDDREVAREAIEEMMNDE